MPSLQAARASLRGTENPSPRSGFRPPGLLGPPAYPGCPGPAASRMPSFPKSFPFRPFQMRTHFILPDLGPAAGCHPLPSIAPGTQPRLPPGGGPPAPSQARTSRLPARCAEAGIPALAPHTPFEPCLRIPPPPLLQVVPVGGGVAEGRNAPGMGWIRAGRPGRSGLGLLEF